MQNLLAHCPNILKHTNSKGEYDFSTVEANVAYAKACLSFYHNLDVEINLNRLCPRVTNRMLYLEYLKSLIESSFPDECVVGLDIGTGHTAIYALLGCVSFDWSFIGTDIDGESIALASENVRRNGMQDKITLIQVNETENCFSALPGNVTFTMCNPPFYASHEELETAKASKNLPASAVELRAADLELVTSGGEVAFIKKMIDDSFVQPKAKWFTSMCGKLSTVGAVVEYLKKRNLDNYAISELVTSQRKTATRRWLVVWSFQFTRPPLELSRCNSVQLKKFNPPRTRFELTGEWSALKQVFNHFFSISIDKSPIKVEFEGPVWSRSFRRKQQAGELIVLAISKAETGIVVDWKYGREFKVFESFQGFLTRQLTSSQFQ